MSNYRVAVLVLLPGLFLFAIITLVLFSTGAMGPAWWSAVGFLALGCGSFWILRVIKALDERIVWLEGTLDAVPQPITVTDLEMRWIFVNKITEKLLRRKRQEVQGRHCSEWKAAICNTDKCGIRSLRSGHPQTHYMQAMPDGSSRGMQVDTSYILDRSGARIGHVEIVTDVHSTAELQSMYSRIASSLEEMSSAMVELEAQTKSNAGNASEASQAAGASQRAVSDGNQQMKQLTAAMHAIGDSSEKVLRINKVIDEIAFQTNILALNAAIEAARAGTAGQGFAVVAEEVRNLAGRVSQAAKETTDLIGASKAAIGEGAGLATRVASFLEEIEGSSQKVNALLGEIACSSAEQSKGISAVSEAVQDLEQKTLKHASSDLAPAETALRVLR
jgi:methyl-accepting chemotaxis protein